MVGKIAVKGRTDSICFVVGYAAMLTVQFALFHGLILFGSTDIGGQGQDWFFNAALVAKVLVLAASAALCAWRPLPFAKATTAIAAFSSLLGFVIMAMSLRFSMLVDEAELFQWFVAGGVCLGCADALAILLWGRAFAALSSRKAYSFVLAGNLVGLCGYAVMGAFPAGAVVAPSGLFLVSLVCVSVVGRTDGKAESDVLCDGARGVAAAEPIELRRAAVSLWRPALGLALFCFMAGLMTKVSGQQNISFSETQAISIVASAACVAILALPVFLVREPSAVDRMYGLALPLSATGFLLLPVFGSAAPGIVNAFAQCGSMMASVVVWCMVARRSHSDLGKAVVLYACVFGLAAFAELCGFAAGGSGLSFFSQEGTPSTAVALASLYLLSCCSLFVFRAQGGVSHSHSPVQGDDGDSSGKKAGSQRSSLPSDRSAACEKLSSRGRLTPKEAEVLVLLSEGRTVRSISERLVVSENTTKSHIKSIYQKLDVHSRSEILELIDKACDREGKTDVRSSDGL